MGNSIEGYSDTAEKPTRSSHKGNGPITSKETETGHMDTTNDDKYASGNDMPSIRFAVSSMQGHRATMEDTHILAPSLRIPSRNKSVEKVLLDHALFSVFDGHGGDFTADYSSKNFLRVLMEREEWTKYANLDKSLRKEVPGILLLKSALSNAFVDIDNELQKIYRNRIEMYGSATSLTRGRSRKQKTLEKADDVRDSTESSRGLSPEPLSHRIMVDRSGSTAVMVLLTPSHIICSNAGDSRAIFSRGGEFLPLSFDHKPSHGRELNRIKEAGGFVKYKRVDGDLAVSRGLGDFRFKLNDALSDKTQKVSSVPEILLYPRDHKKDQFIILGCDGIWDVMANQDCVNVVQGLLDEGNKDLGKLCEKMLDICLERNSKDNMTMCVVTLPAFSYS
mmetsp:Transcript_19353/g.29293  ORF Transcript_19353/g.29293 Transcript_19353/m.29293 type:complete len:392 (-) Transcript_19353:64-1239(-)|eukprot:CAMPEP_0194080136 /NCGR_PEP_ID=MMETSP0149-20130528/6208_1 /TAXON_ID=122233 /ORGANISM="Chaetoceros debilis, Strain MM31A-1" /LENGTH=391 /DNA_ID=CAMNT_0038761781 /DNA_START=587 /DNA_END=1762 /DNA_ORIENTATION=+